MRRFFLTMMLLSLITPFVAQSQSLNPVADVKANEVENSVNVVWSWDKIIPEEVVVDFETGDFSQADFFNDPTSPWAVTNDAYEGTYAIKSTCENVHNGVSAIEITVDVPYDATMSFYHKVDCEYYFDNARFFIDGIERDLITGNVDWTYREFKVSKGVHTYRWTYRKDSGDYGSSTDAYFVDNIVLYKKVESFAGGWVYYDDGHFVQDVGSQSMNIDWAICFPNTEEYAGYNLTKVATYANDLPATVKANIYFGGVDAPQTLVHSQEFKLEGTESMVELQLNAPIPIDGTESLWISFHNECTENNYVYPATGCNDTGNENGDWVSWDKGASWERLSKSKVYLTWMIRGYLENSRGEVSVLSKNETRTQNGYNLYRKYNDNVTVLAENITDTTYTDNTWSGLDYGVYNYGVAAVYDEGLSEIVWSNGVDKDMFTTFELNVETSTDLSVAGAKVNFKNTDNPKYNYSVVLDETGKYQWNKFRRGNYDYTVSLREYETLTGNFIVANEETLTLTLNENLAPVENLTVSPTGWATWESSSFTNGGDAFFYDFDNGLFDGWRTIDADEDGFTWRLTTDIMGPGYGYNGSKYCILSQSYCVDSIGGLTPDNYLITTDKYLVQEGSELSYYVCAQDETCPVEHYSVLISTVDNPTESDFTVLWEETMTRGAVTRGQGAWYKRVFDLSDYAGEEIYIAFRHFNTYGQFYLNLDNIALSNGGESVKSTRALQSFTVSLNGEVVAENITDKYYQFEDLTEGETYTASVVANYISGESAAETYTWTCASTDNYAGLTDLVGRVVAGKALLEWTIEGDEPIATAEDNFSFDFEDGTLNGWVNIDADGDGLVWYNSAEKLGAGYGYEGGNCILSHSYFSGQFNYVVYPDNYLVTEKKYAITETSKLSFVVCAQDPSFYAEHYGVAISMVGNTSPEDFIMVWEETIQSEDTDLETPQTPWETKTVDLSKYAGENVYIAFRHFNCSDQYMVDIDNVTLSTDAKTTRGENELVGFMVYCEDELLTKEPITGRSFYAEFPGYEEYEYCVRAIYSDNGMSAPRCVTVDAPMQCDAPKNLYAETTFNEDGQSGVALTWPFHYSDWLYYCNGNPSSGFSYQDTPFYLGVLFPSEILTDYAGTSLSKINVYDAQEGDGTVLIYYGSTSRPMFIQHQQNFKYSGSKNWMEVELTNPIPVTGKDHIWVLVYQKVVAGLCEDAGNQSNGRWISMNGSEWFDIKALNSAYKYVWALQAFVTSDAETRAIDANRESVLDHYNVYRGQDLENMSVIEETTEGKFFDIVPESGVYYYQVTATYTEGDDVCESAPANSFREPDNDYVKVEVLSIAEDGIDGMVIYPNPTKGNLTIKAEAMTRITIMNALGQVVYDNNVATDNEIINMNQYETGVYLVRIATETGVAVKRVSVVR